jgi:hypothetical protein
MIIFRIDPEFLKIYRDFERADSDYKFLSGNYPENFREYNENN